MKGIYFVTSSKLSLNGIPKDAGKYLISVSVEDTQGRKAESNALPFVIYTGEETLAEQIKIEPQAVCKRPVCRISWSRGPSKLRQQCGR